MLFIEQLCVMSLLVAPGGKQIGFFVWQQEVM